jgi:hypothetical protein
MEFDEIQPFVLRIILWNTVVVAKACSKLHKLNWREFVDQTPPRLLAGPTAISGSLGRECAATRDAVLRGLGFLNRPDQIVRCVAFVVDCEFYALRHQGLCGTQRHSIRPGTHFANDRRWLGGRGYSCSVAAFTSRATAASYCAWSRWPMPDFRRIVFRPARRPFESDFG